MKTFSINKIQLIVLAALLTCYTLAIISYRVFVERPELERNITLLSQREISSLILSARKMTDSLNSSARDHAAWTATYEFSEDNDPQFIEQIFTKDTFSNLKIDGFFILDEQLNTLASMGFNHQTSKEISFDFNDFERYPENKNMFPIPSTAKGVPQKRGVIATNLGAAIFTAVQIRNSELTGEHRGWVIFLRLISPELFEELSAFILASVSYSIIMDGEAPPGSLNIHDDLEQKAKIDHVREYSYLFVPDINSKPLLLITIAHSNGKMPPFMDLRGIFFTLLLAFLVILIYALVNRYLVTPAVELSKNIKQIADSADISLIEKTYYISELQDITDNFNHLIKQVQDQTTLLAQQANIDQLTQIPNRRKFEEVFARHVELYIRRKIGFAMVMVDVDHFKQFNDFYGHIHGDKALINVAQALAKHCKRPIDICARYGGEEFVLLIHDIEEEHLNAKLNEIKASFKSLNMPHASSPTAPYLTVSLGAYIVAEQDIIEYRISLKSLLEKVDKALYQAKDAGRNRAAIYSNTDDITANTEI